MPSWSSEFAAGVPLDTLIKSLVALAGLVSLGCSDPPDPTYKGVPLSEVLERTKDSDLETATDAVLLVQEFDEHAIPRLRQALSADHSMTRSSAAGALEKFCSDEAIDALEDRNRDPSEQFFTYRAIWNCRPNRRQEVENWLNRPHDAHLCWDIAMMVYAQPPIPSSERRRKCLLDKSATARAAVLATYSTAPDEVGPLVAAMVWADPDPGVRASAARALEGMPYWAHRYLDHIADSLREEPSPQVRRSILFLLPSVTDHRPEDHDRIDRIAEQWCAMELELSVLEACSIVSRHLSSQRTRRELLERLKRMD